MVHHDEKKTANALSGERTDLAEERTKLAVKRTMMAADRSLMAWIRTGLSLISFGFTIYKFLEYEKEQMLAVSKHVASISSPKVVGLFMIGFGILSLVLGTIENVMTVKALRQHYVLKQSRFSLIIAGMITILGVILFAGILLKLKGIG